MTDAIGAPPYLRNTQAGLSDVNAGTVAVKYVKQQLEALISTGLEECLLQRPADPVTFLAQHLKDANPNRVRHERRAMCTVKVSSHDPQSPSNEGHDSDLRHSNSSFLDAPMAASQELCTPQLEKAPCSARVPVTLTHISRSLSTPAFRQLGPYPVFVSFAPGVSDVADIVDALRLAVNDRHPTGTSVDVDVILVRRSEVLYLDGCLPFHGDLTATLRSMQYAAAAAAPAARPPSFSEIIAEAEEALLEGLLEDAAIRSCSTVHDVLAAAALRQRPTADAADVAFHLTTVLPTAVTYSFADLDKADALLSRTVGGGPGGVPAAYAASATSGELPLLRPAIILGFEPEAERCLLPTAMIPLLAHHCHADYARLSRLQRAEAERRVLEVMKSVKRGLLAPGRSPLASSIEVDNERKEVSATTRAIQLHGKLLRRRAERMKLRKQAISELEATEDPEGEGRRAALERVIAQRVSRHEYEEAVFNSAVHRIVGAAATRIQALARGFLVRLTHRISFRTARSPSERNTLFETTFASTATLRSNEISETARAGSLVHDRGPSSSSSGLIDGEFPLVRLFAHRIAELDQDLFTLERPAKPRPQRSFTVVQQRTRRVPPQCSGDVSSEDESLEQTVVGTKPPPLTKRQFLVNPIFHLHKCLEEGHSQRMYHFIRDAATTHRGVHAVQRRAFRCQEQLCVWGALVAFLALAHRGRLQPQQSFRQWSNAALAEQIAYFGHPQLFTQSVREGPRPCISATGPHVADLGVVLVSPAPSLATASFASDVPTVGSAPLVRICDGVSVAPTALSLPGWQSSIEAIVSEDHATSLVWVHCSRHPMLYVGERLCAACSIGHPSEWTAERKQGKAAQFNNALVVAVTSKAESTAASGGRRPSQTALDAAGPSPTAMRPHPPRRRPSQGPQGMVSHQEVGFMLNSDGITGTSDGPQPVSSFFQDSSSILSLDWSLWEARLRDAVIAKINSADGLVTTFSRSDHHTTWVEEALRVTVAKRNVRDFAECPALPPAGASPLSMRSMRALSTKRESLASQGSEARSPSAAAGSAIFQRNGDSAADAPGSNVGAEPGTAGQHRRRPRMKSTRLSTRSTHASRAPSDASGTSAADGRTNSSEGGVQPPREGPDAATLLPESADRVVRDLATAASEVFAGVADVRCAPPGDDGCNGARCSLHRSTSASHLSSAVRGADGGCAPLRCVRAPMGFMSPLVVLQCAENLARIVREVHSVEASASYGSNPALVLASPVVHGERDVADLAFISAIAAVVRGLECGDQQRFKGAARHSLMQLKESLLVGGAESSRRRHSQNSRRRASSCCGSVTGAQQGLSGDSASNNNETETQITDDHESPLLAAEGDDIVPFDLTPPPMSDEQVAARELSRNFPGAAALVAVLDSLELIFVELLPGANEESSSPATEVLTFVCHVVAQLPAELREIFTVSKLRAAAMRAADSNIPPVERATAAAEASRNWERLVVIVLLASFLISPVTTSFASFVEGTPPIADFLSTFDPLAALGVAAGPLAQRFAARELRWRLDYEEFPISCI